MPTLTHTHTRLRGEGEVPGPEPPRRCSACSRRGVSGSPLQLHRPRPVQSHPSAGKSVAVTLIKMRQVFFFPASRLFLKCYFKKLNRCLFPFLPSHSFSLFVQKPVLHKSPPPPPPPPRAHTHLSEFKRPGSGGLAAQRRVPMCARPGNSGKYRRGEEGKKD